MVMILRAVAFFAALSLGWSAHAQAPQTPPTQTYTASTGTGTAAALPAPAAGAGGPLQFALFQNRGTVDISYALGSDNTVTVAAGNTIPVVQAGGCQLVFVASKGFIAVATSSGTSTLQVSLQYGGPLPASCPGNSGSGTVVVKPAAVTPAAGTASTVTTGGTAVTLITGPINGGYISNPPNAASQGIVTAENACIDPVTTPGSTDGNCNGTASLLQPGQLYPVPPLVTGVLIKGNAVTNGHKLNVVVW